MEKHELELVTSTCTMSCNVLLQEIEIEIVYNMYRMRRFTLNTVCAGCCLWALPTMPYMELTSQG
jgi:hypothetical protein